MARGFVTTYASPGTRQDRPDVAFWLSVAAPFRACGSWTADSTSLSQVVAAWRSGTFVTAPGDIVEEAADATVTPVAGRK